MELSGGMLLVVLLCLGVVALIGGRLSVNKDGITLDTKGIVDIILKIREMKAIDNRLEPAAPGTVEVKKLPAATVLWVDDRTQNNILEREALAKLGVRIECYTSNVAALEVFDRIEPDLVISDIGRPDDEDGWQLLDSLRADHTDLPFYFYTGRVNEGLQAKAATHAATGIFDDPGDLIEAVVQVI